MNTAHLHLLLNHFPIIGTLIGSGLLVWGLTRKQDNTKSAGALILLLMAIIAVAVYLTGEPAEDSVEKLPGVSETMIELHEEAATWAIWLMSITGVVSFLAILSAWRNRLIAQRAFVMAFVLSLITFGAMARTGYYGGQIRHTEISNASTLSNENNSEQGKEKEEKEEEKD